MGKQTVNELIANVNYLGKLSVEASALLENDEPLFFSTFD